MSYLFALALHVDVKYYLLKFYFSSEREPLSYREENYKVNEVPALLKELGTRFGLAYEAHDVSKMESMERERLYSLAAHWASTSFSPITVYEVLKGYDIFSTPTGNGIS